MKFRQAVLNTPELADAYRPGLQALKRADAEHITFTKPRDLAGSVDVDSALCEMFPNKPRWDYAIGIKYDLTSDRAIWIEVHPASSTGEVNVVIAKLRWLKSWAADAAPDLLSLTREYVWIATGSVAFSQASPQRKKLASEGIRFAGNRYTIC
ncbi:hypothetical protein L0Z72_03545 [candidate division KSB1 bacterium]|nr:hypothetical protein [candidate division KSB1 bacterium]